MDFIPAPLENRLFPGVPHKLGQLTFVDNAKIVQEYGVTMACCPGAQLNSHVKYVTIKADKSLRLMGGSTNGSRMIFVARLSPTSENPTLDVSETDHIFK
jgi:hypothetical protein